MVPLEQRNATRLKWPDAVALLMIDEPEALSPERRLAQVAVQFRLSPTELKLTQALMQGDTLARFAEHQSIAISTMRTHLRHIFEKTGVRRQGDLIRLVGEAQGRAAWCRTANPPQQACVSPTSTAREALDRSCDLRAASFRSPVREAPR